MTEENDAPRGATESEPALLTIPLRATIRALALLTILLAVINLFVLKGTATGALEPYQYIRRWFTMDYEANVPTWLSIVLMLACAALLAVNGAVARARGERFSRHWFALGLLFVWFSLDEAASFHEAMLRPLQQALGTSGPLLYAWVIPGALFAALVALLFLPFVRSLSAPVRWRIVAAGAIYVAGALGMEMVGAWYYDIHQRPRLIYMGLTTIEEVLEIAGLIAFLHALLFRLRAERAEVLISVRS